jgi:hypothetical protein
MPFARSPNPDLGQTLTLRHIDAAGEDSACRLLDRDRKNIQVRMGPLIIEQGGQLQHARATPGTIAIATANHGPCLAAANIKSI